MNVTQINVHQATGVPISNEQRKEQGAQTSHNLTEGSTGGTTGSNMESTANNNPRSNMDNTANNNSSIQQTAGYRSENS